MDNELPSDCEVLALFSHVTRNKSPAQFADWCGCTLDEAIEIFAGALGCLYVVVDPPTQPKDPA